MGINHYLVAASENSNPVVKDIFSSPKFSNLNTASKEFYLSENEKYVVALVNLVRCDPKAFINEVILKSGIDSNKMEISHLIRELKIRKNIFPLLPAFSLYKSAMVHAKDMGQSGLFGHTGSDGQLFKDRIQQYFPTNTELAENFYIGSGDPVDVVMSFLLEKGEKGRQYKINILSENIHFIGISIQPHRLKCTNAVLDFAKKPSIPEAAIQLKKKSDMEVYWKDCPSGPKVAPRKKSSGFSLGSLWGGKRK